MLETIQILREILTRREKFQLLAVLVAIVAMAFSQAIGVVSVLPFISLVMDPDLIFENQWLNWAYTTFKFISIKRFIIFSGLTMFAIIVLSNSISALATWLKLRFVWMNNHRLSRRLLEKYLAMPYVFFLNKNSSGLSQNVLSEIEHLTNSFLIPLLNIITRSMLVMFMMGVLFIVNPVVSAIAILFIGGTYRVIYYLTNKQLHERGTKRFEANELRYKTVNEAFGGIKEIKVTNRETYFLGNYSKASYSNALHSSWSAVIAQLPRFAIEAVAFGGIIIFVLVLLMAQESAQQVIPIASVFAFAGYRVMPALQEIFTCFAQLQFNQAVLGRIHKDITGKEEKVLAGRIHQPDQVEPLIFNDEIKLSNITYNYPNATHPVLKDINLSIRFNSSIAFVGPTGAGKTTLVDIILGLLPPQHGELLVDGTVINRENLPRWQKLIGYVPQFIYLSDDTISRNIAFGIPESEICQEELERVARAANIYDFIADELPDGFSTIVGERGIRLSGGQRQRIGIARALYNDPVVLVFDEATSALDGVTEEAVLTVLENAAQQKTLIIIAHRLTTVKNCDMVYMVDKGRIVDRGTYNELLRTNEQFKSMAKIKTAH